MSQVMWTSLPRRRNIYHSTTVELKGWEEPQGGGRRGSVKGKHS